MAEFTSNTFATTYKDDFKDSDNYHRVLFNSGKALQARELTQLQTIIQEELKRFGSHIFKDGSLVIPGGLSLDTIEFVKLKGTPSNVGDFSVGDILTEDTTGIKARIIRIESYVSASEPATFYITYIDSGTQVPTSAPVRFTPNATIRNASNDAVQVQQTNTTENPAVGAGTALSVSTGSFFALGHFVQCNQQTILVSKYSATPTVDVGFKVTEDIVTASDNSALYDNQNVLPNETAPGADRYRIQLTLITADNLQADDNFVYLNRLVNGEFLKEIDRSTYNIIGEETALRTFEESGNYIVESLDLDYTADSAGSTTTIVAEVGPGVAYVQGYRFNQDTTLPITVNKARDFETVENDVVSAYFGNYVNIDGTTAKAFPNINVLEPVNLYSDSSIRGSVLGTARVRQVEENGADYKYYLFDISMTGSNKFTDTQSIGVDSTNYGNLILENSVAVLKEADENNLFFPLSKIRPKAISDISLTVQRRFTATTDGTNGQATLDVSANPGETFTSTGQWIAAFDSDGSIITPTNGISGSGTNSATLDFGSTYINQNIEVLALVNKTSPSGSNNTGNFRAKTLTETTVTAAIDSDGNGIKFVPLTKADIYSVSRVRTVDSDGTDVAGLFTLDNGQRDNFYQQGRMILNTGVGTPTDNIFVRYKYFAHGAGAFFAAASYSDLDLEDIPKYTNKLGETIELRNVLDFRPRKGDNDAEYSAGTAIVNELPINTDTIQLDVDYYQPRRDIVVVNVDNEIKYIEGTSAFNPVPPTVPNDAMQIYAIDLEPYTDNEDDVTFEPVGNRRYTMADIANLEDRIDRIEETTTLSLLETQTANIEVLDANGNNRFKNGFFADNFKNIDFIDTETGEFFASFDEEQDLIQPLFTTKNVNLFADSAASTNIKVAGELVMLNYQDSAVITQLVASETENVNPYNIITHVGSIELTPSVDFFTEVNEVRAGRIITAQVQQRNVFGAAALRARLTRGRRVTPRLRRRVAAAMRRLVLSNRRNQRRIRPLPNTNLQWNVTTTRRTAQNGTTITTTRERTELSDFIRPRLVFFKARGLRPNSRHFAFFDGTSVTNFVRSETAVRRDSRRLLQGAVNRNSTAHPNSATTLTTDDKGEITGSFFIPANTFRTGDREFKLIDISVDDEDAALSHASSSYSGNGRVVTREISTRFIPRPRPRRRRARSRRRDPLAQSFQLPMETGGFVSKINVFFRTRPATDIPVRMQIRPMIAGVPSEDFIAETSVNRDDVTIPSNLESLSDIVAAPTSFVFEEPVYLQAETEYAFVLLSSSDDYNAYVAKAGDFEIGTTERRIRRQPVLGSLFMSQNSRTWTPDQERDMMFQLFAASFDTSVTGTAYLRNDDLEDDLLENNPIFVDSGSSTVFFKNPNHGLVKGDVISIGGIDSSDDIGGIAGSSILGDRTVVNVDGYGFTITADSSATASTVAGSNDITVTQNIMFDRVIPNIETFIRPEVSLSMTGNFRNGVSLSTAGDASNVAYSSSATNHPFNGNEPIILTAPGVIAGRKIEIAELGASTRSANITATLTTTNKYLSPVIDMQTAELGLFNNIIDNQVDSAGVDTTLTNVPINYVAETDPVDGTSIAKYVSKNINLEEPAVGLKILIGANRPSNTFIDVYYKLVSAGDDTDINELNYVLIEEESNNPSDDDTAVFREYEYLIGGQSGTLTPFDTFKIKVVFRSGNSSKVPRLRDIRAIALGT